MKIIIITLGVMGILAAFQFKTIKNLLSNKNASAAANMETKLIGSFYDFKVKSLDGKPVDLTQYKGKKVVIINVASKCGFTPQYADWQAFHQKYGEKIVVLGFPANNFLSQEPGNNDEIASFCQKNYGVTFQMFEKVEVIGELQHPLFKWLSKKDENGWNNEAPTWNFCKYVINEEGKLTHFFASKITPENPEFKIAVGI